MVQQESTDGFKGSWGNNLLLAVFGDNFTKENVERIRKRIVEQITDYPGDVVRYSHVGTTVIWVMGFLPRKIQKALDFIP